jgi:phage-related protein
MVETQRIIPKKFFRFLEGSDGIYEVRVEVESKIYRVFCCMDEGSVVVLFHGIQKKSQKTPLKEIKRAETIKKDYFKSKEA